MSSEKEKHLDNANEISDVQSTEMIEVETMQSNCNLTSSGDSKIDSLALNGGIVKTSDQKDDDTPNVQIEESTKPNEDFVVPLQNLVKHVSWNCYDAEYYLKEVHQQQILSEDAKNIAMAQMLKSFVDETPPVAPLQDTEKPEFDKLMRKASSNRRTSDRKSSQKRVADQDCDFVYEKMSKSPKKAIVKTEDVLLS